MNEPETKKVTFLKVTTNAEKLNTICRITDHHFHKKEAVLIIVPSSAAATYIDQLLWRHPANSFLPHAIANSETGEQVTITTLQSNINQAKAVINLCSTHLVNASEFATIYDLYDLTDTAKKELSEKRQAAYVDMGFTIEEQ